MKKQHVWVGVVAAAVIALWLVSQEGLIGDIVNNLNPTLSSSASPSASPVVSSTPVASGKATPKVSPRATSTPAVVYSQLISQYAGRRIQFDQYCQADPRSTTFKNNTSIMLDNRSGDARIVTVGGVQHSLSGYGYKIITLSSSVLPKTLTINCGAAVNVGTILLQK